MKTQPREPLFTNLYRERKTRITNCYGELCADSPAKRFSHTQACINMPSVKAERSQSPECAVKRATNAEASQTTCRSREKVPTDTAAHVGIA